jgi:hypothetical protein
MTPQQILDTLSRNRLLETKEQVSAFEKALEQVASHPEVANHLRELHLVLDDQTRQTEVMYGLVHLLESFDMEQQLRAFLEVFPQLMKQAPEWVKTLHFRVLNDDAARGTYRTLLRHANTPSRTLALSALADILETEDAPLRDHASEILAE